MWTGDLPQLESGGNAPASSVIDLRTIEQDRRNIVWGETARNSWPGISVRLEEERPTSGSIRRISLGAGQLYQVESVAAEVDFRPIGPARGGDAFISLMMLAEGHTTVRQGGRRSGMDRGDICLLDEASAFKLVAEERSRICFLRLPRSQVIGRYPQLERLFAHSLPASDAGTRLLGDLLLRLLVDAPLLAEPQRRALMGGLVQMLGVMTAQDEVESGARWRVRRALDFIELNLSVPGLSAECVAREQRISRRRLDQIMQDEVGQSIAGHLWTRRLEQAALDLRDPARVDEAVSRIAFANGFGDAAHFTRAFKRRYAVTPGQWRLN